MPIFDSFLSDRWAWWMACLLNRRVGDWQIPRINFSETASQSPYESVWRARYPDLAPKMIETIGTRQGLAKSILDLVQTFTYRTHAHRALRIIVDAFLYAFGDPQTPKPPTDLDPREEHALAYAIDDLVPKFMAHPGDWAARIISENLYPKGNALGWFPTPMCICELMSAMTFEGDSRFKTVLEPCLGTGAMLLAASNHSLRLSGCDIDNDMIAWSKFQAFLYVPWLAIPGDGIIAEFTNPKPEPIPVTRIVNGIRNPPTRIMPPKRKP